MMVRDKRKMLHVKRTEGETHWPARVWMGHGYVSTWATDARFCLGSEGRSSAGYSYSVRAFGEWGMDVLALLWQLLGDKTDPIETRGIMVSGRFLYPRFVVADSSPVRV